MMQKLITGILSLALTLTASNALATINIEWWHALGGANAERVNKIVNDFNAIQSQYKVLPISKGNYTETMTAAIAAFRAKKQPHIVQVFEVGTATMMAAEGAIYPIEKLMEDTGQVFNRNSFLPAVVSYYTSVNGKLLSMPFNSSTPVLYYNKDAFKKAGIDSAPKTWSEVVSTSKKLIANGQKCGFTIGWQSWTMIENFSAWHNTPIGTRNNGFTGFDAELTFNNDVVKRHVSNLNEWQKEGVFSYGGRRSDSQPKFVNNECAMWITSSSSYGSLRKLVKFDLGQALMPYYDDVVASPQNSIIGGASLWVLSGHETKEYQGVAEFMTFLSSPKIQAWWHQESGYVPITKAAYELSREQGFYEKFPGTDTAIKALSLNKPTANSGGLRFGNFVQIRDIVNEELEAVWNGSKSASDALDLAVARGNKLLRKFERANK